MRRVIARPATCITAHDDGPDDIVICLEAWLTDEHQWPHTIELHAAPGESVYMLDANEIDVDIPGMLTGKSSPSGYDLTVRAVEDDDCVGMPGLPDFPTPAPVVAAILAGENMDTHLEALAEEDGFVTTLLLVTDVGLWLRYSGSWLKLHDINLIDGLDSVNVSAGAIDLYDTADRAGTQLPVSSLPGPSQNIGGPYYNELHIAESAQRTFTEPVTAAMMTIPIAIETVRDLPGAVEAATRDESIRWYVERRAHALDPEFKLPWESDDLTPLADEHERLNGVRPDTVIDVDGEHPYDG